jgi:hypothetical protein
VDGLERHLGIVGTGLDAQVSAAPQRVEGIAREGRQVDRGLRPLQSESEAAVEEARSEAHGEGQPAGPETEGLTTVRRG